MEEKVTYSKEWIKQVRNGMNKKTFASKIYTYKKNGTECSTVHRNTIRNWETGEVALPRDVETFLSIALIEYDNENKDKDKMLNRNARFQHAKKRLKQMLGVELYCRNLHDALLISVCRGILGFEDVLHVERELEEDLERDHYDMPKERLDLYAIERNTKLISKDLNKVKDLDELRDCITNQYRSSFAAANRIIGARVVKIYNSRQRFPEKVSFFRAVENLAPNYRNSYVRMFRSSFISREWLIDLCQHLCFDRGEIEAALEASHMAKLGKREKLLGSLSAFQKMSISEKLKVMFLLAIYVDESGWYEEKDYPPAIHLLESLVTYDQGKRAIQALGHLIEDEHSGNWSLEELTDKIYAGSGGIWMNYLNDVIPSISYDPYLQQMNMQKTIGYEALPVPVAELFEKEGKEALMRLHYLACLYYTVLTGDVFAGVLKEDDLFRIRKMLAKEYDEYPNFLGFVSRFVTRILVVFLGNEPIKQVQDGCFDLTGSTSPKTSLGMENMKDILWNCVCLMSE